MTPQDGIEDGFDPLDIEAVDWVVRLTVGALSDEDREAFDRWSTSSPAHGRAFAAASDLCGHLRRIPLDMEGTGPAGAAEPIAQHDNVLPFVAPAPRQGEPIAQPHRRLSRRSFLGGGAVAASLAGGLMAVNPPLGLWPSLAELMADERTGAGERRSFSPLAGVAIELNSRSSASRADGGKALDLIGGEAFVTVAGLEQPFRVTAGGGTLMTREASFNVQSYDGDLCVTCVKGSVEVAREGRSEALRAGREIVFAANGERREDAADPLVRLAWRRGLLILRSTPVSQAIPQINRYFPGRLVLTDSSKSGWPVTGVFHIEQIDLAVVQLQRLLNVKATRLPGGVVLLG